MNYTNNLNQVMFDLETNYGLKSLVDFCKTNPRLGDNEKQREINSWLTILNYFIKQYKRATNENDEVYTQEIESIFNNVFWYTPTQFRNDIGLLILENAKEVGIDVGLDISNIGSPQMVLNVIN